MTISMDKVIGERRFARDGHSSEVHGSQPNCSTFGMDLGCLRSVTVPCSSYCKCVLNIKS
jgi:hypothetical protein